MFERILICSDGSEQALEAARLGCDIARRYSSRVTVLFVYDTPEALAYSALGYNTLLGHGLFDPDRVKRQSEEAHRRVEEQTDPVIRESVVECEYQHAEGNPVETILQVAKELQVGLIVLGSRGLGGFKSLMLGSVSDGVLHHAHCPILVAR